MVHKKRGKVNPFLLDYVFPNWCHGKYLCSPILHSEFPDSTEKQRPQLCRASLRSILVVFLYLISVTFVFTSCNNYL